MRPSTRHLARAIVALAFLLCPLAGCGPTGPSSAEPETAQHTDRIINGVPSGPEDDEVIGIAILDSDGQVQATCTGSLVAENVVLTARHCVSKTLGEGVACAIDGKPLGGTGGVGSDYPPQQLAIFLGSKAQGYTPEFVAKGAKIFHTAINNLCNNDLALIVLDQRLVGAQLAQLRLDAPPVKGELMTAIGWGVANNSGTTWLARRLRRDIPVVSVGPVSTANGPIGPNEFEIGEGICSGDSGGPAIAQSTGAVIGVVTRGGNGYRPANPNFGDPAQTCTNFTGTDGVTYRAFNIYTRVDGFKDVILEAFQEAGTEPWLEGGPDPRKAKLGASCDGPDACRSGLCVAVGASAFCSQVCDAGNACPDGYACSSAGDQRVCAVANVDAGLSSRGGCSVAVDTAGEARAPLALGMGLAALMAISVARRRRGAR